MPPLMLPEQSRLPSAALLPPGSMAPCSPLVGSPCSPGVAHFAVVSPIPQASLAQATPRATAHPVGRFDFRHSPSFCRSSTAAGSPAASPVRSPVLSSVMAASPIASPSASPKASNGAVIAEDRPEEEQDVLLGKVVAGKYAIRSRVGSGSFGCVYRCQHSTKNYEVALKMEPLGAKHPQLSHEFRVYRMLQERGVGVPGIYWYGEEEGHRMLAMDLLGPSLSDLHERCGGVFSLETSVAIMEQIMHRLEEVHGAGLIHRDLKPDNFCMGVQSGANADKVYIIDFGCAKRYLDPETRKHIPDEQGKCMVGTARYASLRAHLGAQLSRRDDLEVAGYMLVWFLKGRLPWQGLAAASSQERMAKIAEMKAKTPLSTLCADLPREIEGYLSYVRGLQFEDEPDYAHLRSMLRASLGHQAASRPLRLDWQRSLPPAELRFDSPPRRRAEAGGSPQKQDMTPVSNGRFAVLRPL